MVLLRAATKYSHISEHKRSQNDQESFAFVAAQNVPKSSFYSTKLSTKNYQFLKPYTALSYHHFLLTILSNKNCVDVKFLLFHDFCPIPNFRSFGLEVVKIDTETFTPKYKELV